MDDSIKFLYKYVDYRGAKDILQNLRLRFTSVKIFKDETDIHPSINLTFDESQFYTACIEKIISNMKAGKEPLDSVRSNPIMYDTYKRHREDPHLSIETFDYAIKSSLINIHNYFHLIQRLWKNNRNSMYLLCLTESENANYMWQEYSNQYSGACIKFVNPILHSSIMDSMVMFGKVVYDDRELTLATLDEMVIDFTSKTVLDTTRIFKQYSLTKKTKYSDEKEWRYIWEIRNDKREFFYKTIDEHAIDCIYLGKHMKEHHKNNIIRLAESRNIRIQM